MGISASVSQSSGVVYISWTGDSAAEYARDYDFYIDGEWAGYRRIAANVQPGSPAVSESLPDYGTYTCSCVVSRVDTGETIASGSTRVTWREPEPPFIVNRPTPSSTAIVEGSHLSISWTYSGTPNATYWYLLGSTGTNISTATTLNSKAVSGASLIFESPSWTHVGEWHFWIVCANSNPQTSGTASSYCTVTVTPHAGMNISVFDGNNWIENCKIYVFDGNNWVEGTLDIYNGGWSS